MRFNNFWCYRRILFSKGFVTSVLLSKKNLIAFRKNRSLPGGPYMVELDITYRCNCCCRMCQRWKDPRGGELSVAEYQELANLLQEMGSHQISIAGGEPLLRDDAFSIIEHFSRLGMSVNLCTNGLLLKKYHAEICQSGATCVTISLDGASAESHDHIRGMPGSYRQIEEGISRLLEHPTSSRPIIRLRMTISNRNVDEIRVFYQKWNHIVDDVLVQPVHHCREAFYTGMDADSLFLDPHLISDQITNIPLEKDNYLKHLIESLKSCRSFPYQHCYAGVLMARIDPWGIVYPCLEQHVSAGSIRETDFRSIWNSKFINKERDRLASDRSCRCWYNNTALIGYYGNLLEKSWVQLLWDLLRNCHKIK
jgi:MoaA/NifB/PqqE/SkfB family radical SAM enzyme